MLEHAIWACRTDPAAADIWVEVELLDELVDCYEAVGRVDDAITAMRRALQVGWHGEPDGRCRIAELLMRDGRVAEATRSGRRCGPTPPAMCGCTTTPAGSTRRSVTTWRR